jgi:hypothetical protein
MNDIGGYLEAREFCLENHRESSPLGGIQAVANRGTTWIV